MPCFEVHGSFGRAPWRNDWHSLLKLLEFPQGKPKQLRTVSLRFALRRVRTFVHSKVSEEALETLVDLRDGAIHIGANTEAEERLLLAFVQFADSLLADLGRDRKAFWGNQLMVANALLKEASDKVAYRVEVKIQAARTWFEHEYRDLPKELRAEVVSYREAFWIRADEEGMRCPVCNSTGLGVR